MFTPSHALQGKRPGTLTGQASSLFGMACVVGDTDLSLLGSDLSWVRPGVCRPLGLLLSLTPRRVSPTLHPRRVGTGGGLCVGEDAEGRHASPEAESPSASETLGIRLERRCRSQSTSPLR